MKYLKKDKAKLIADCERLKALIGMGTMHVDYVFRKADGSSLADCLMYVWGWKSRITFYDKFFQSEEKLQRFTMIHELVHVAMIPFDSQVEWIVESLPKKQHQKARFNLRTAREIVVDRLAGAFKELL